MIIFGTEWGCIIGSLSVMEGSQNYWVGLVLWRGGWGSHHRGGLWHTNTLLPCDFLSPLSNPFRTKGTQSLTFVLVVPLVRSWLQETDNRAPSKPESTVSGCLPVSGRAHMMARTRGRETQRESVRQGKESARASGRCPIHPIEDTLLHLNGPFGFCRPRMLMCTGADSTMTDGHSGCNRALKKNINTNPVLAQFRNWSALLDGWYISQGLLLLGFFRKGWLRRNHEDEAQSTNKRPPTAPFMASFAAVSEKTQHQIQRVGEGGWLKAAVWLDESLIERLAADRVLHPTPINIAAGILMVQWQHTVITDLHPSQGGNNNSSPRNW